MGFDKLIATRNFRLNFFLRTMQLQSPVFANNGAIPVRYTCKGDSISPPLAWENPPQGTSSFALIVEDPDSPQGSFVHWVVYDIPATAHQLNEGIATNQAMLPRGGAQGRNDYGQLGFGGPCPIAEDGSEKNPGYYFKLYALDQPLDLPPGVNKGRVVAAMDGHILELAELIGHHVNSD